MSAKTGNCPHCGDAMFHPQRITCGDSYCSELHQVERILAGHCAKHQKTKAMKAQATARRLELQNIIDERLKREKGE